MPNIKSMENTKNEKPKEKSVVSSRGETRNEAFGSLGNSSLLSETEEILALVFCSNTDLLAKAKIFKGPHMCYNFSASKGARKEKSSLSVVVSLKELCHIKRRVTRQSWNGF